MDEKKSFLLPDSASKMVSSLQIPEVPALCCAADQVLTKLVCMQEVRQRPSASPGQADAEMELDDDELLDMMGDMPSEPTPLPTSNLPPVTNTLPGMCQVPRGDR